MELVVGCIFGIDAWGGIQACGMTRVRAGLGVLAWKGRKYD